MSSSRIEETRAYYDEFSQRYEEQRRPRDPVGYHALVDDLEVELVKRYGEGKNILECGCGTGLILERIAEFAEEAVGVDLSPGMLSLAKARGLTVKEACLTKLPFEDASFDLCCSFKVLAHVENVGLALSEMARVTKPGGVILAEFYNPVSFRALLKKIGPAKKISDFTRESAVYTRFDSPWSLPRILPAGTKLEAYRGVRIVTVAAKMMQIPFIRKNLMKLEWRLADTWAAHLAGFYIAVIRK